MLNAVVFNNVSGDVFSADQQAALKAFLENGGGYVGIHAAGDNSHEGWPWYQNEVIGVLYCDNPRSKRRRISSTSWFLSSILTAK